MDVESVLLIVAAVVGTVTAIAHLLGYLPKRYRSQLAQIQAGVATSIGSQVERALNASLDRQRALTLEDMKAAQTAAEAEYASQIKGAEMSIVRGVGVDRQLKGKVDRLLGEAILGPALPLLRQFAPGLADALEENPGLIDVVVQNPLFRKYVAPRLEQYLGGGGAQAPPETGGWGT